MISATDSSGSHHVHRIAQENGTVVFSRIHRCEGIHFFVCIRPDIHSDFEDQVKSLYRKFDGFLKEQRVARHHVITEKVFFSDLRAQVETYRRIRERFYREVNGQNGGPPATTYLHQPPCESGVLCELQARLALPSADSPVVVRDLQGLIAPASGKVVSSAGFDHFYLHNLTGGSPGDNLDFAGQMDAVFKQAEKALEQEGLTFRDVIRTWLYIDRMARDYAALNRVRTAFFKKMGVERMPASTGIQGGVYPCDRGGALDLYALRAKQPVEIKQMHASTLNEAWTYGSGFSRGMTVTRGHWTMAYISGTASIDAKGQVAHVGDIEGQVHRMLLNVEELLAGSGGKTADIVRATTYLKHAKDVQVFKRIYAARGFPLDIPHTICSADVCRPEWLVEIEAAAIFHP